MSTAAMAGWVGAIRSSCPQLSLLALEVLLLVADGATCSREITERLVTPASQSNVTRTINLLLGRAQWRQGKWLESPFQLLSSRPHPHVRGAAFLDLSEEGRTLVQGLHYASAALMQQNAA
jgi:hypothetical protein